MATKLKRSLSLFDVTLYGIGVILGAGVYVIIGKAAGLAGNSVWLSFVIGAIIAIFTGLSYAELSSMFDKEGGEHTYVQRAFNSQLAFLVGWLVILGGVISGAAVALGFAGYFNAVFNTPVLLTAIAAILILTFVNFWGIKKASMFNIVATFIDIAGLILIAVLGIKFFGNVSITDIPPTGFKGIVSGAALLFFAFLGFEGIVRLGEETKNPKKVIPKAIIISLIVTTILYVLVGISAVSVLGWEKLSVSTAPLADVAAVALGSQAFLVLSIIALFSTMSTVLVILISTSRMIYGMAEDKALPKIFQSVNKQTKTPWVAIIMTALATIAFVLIGDLEKVASLTNFTIFGVFAIVNAALISLRYKVNQIKHGFKSPINIGKFPVLAGLGVVASVLMMFQFEFNIILSGIALSLFGIGLYYLFNYGKKKQPIFKTKVKHHRIHHLRE